MLERIEAKELYKSTKRMWRKSIDNQAAQSIALNLLSLAHNTGNDNVSGSLIQEIQNAEGINKVNKVIGFRHQLIGILDEKILGIKMYPKKDRNMIPVIEGGRAQDGEKQESKNVEKNNKTIANMGDGAFECNKLDVEESIQIVTQQNVSNEVAYRALNTFKHLPTVLDGTREVDPELKVDLKNLTSENAIDMLTTYKEIIINEFGAILPEHIPSKKEEDIVQKTVAA